MFEIDKYLSHEEMKALAIEAYKDTIRTEIANIKGDHMISDYDRVVSNAVYYYLESEIDGIVGLSAKDVIEKKIKELLERDDLQMTVFRSRSPWHDKPSIGMQIVENAVRNNQDLIDAKVVEQIKNLDFGTMKSEIIEGIYSAITEHLATRTA